MKQIIATLLLFTFLYQVVAASRAADYSEVYREHEYLQQQPQVYVAPVPVPAEPRCHRVTEHDDILDTTDWREECED
jgi:hypothetical protein